MSEDEVREKVREMAKLSVLTDRISEVHEANLKKYPFIFFEGLTTARISYDLHNSMAVDDRIDVKNVNIDYDIKPINTSHLRVSYHLTIDERLNGHLDKRFSAIENAVRTLFWKEVSVEVYFNGTLKFKSLK